MRTLIEIIEAAKDGDRPTADECYFAMLALDALSTFTTSALRKTAYGDHAGSESYRKMQAEEDFRRWKGALRTPPNDYLGPGHTPGNPEQVRWRKMAKAVLAKVEAEQEEPGAGGEDG